MQQYGLFKQKPQKSGKQVHVYQFTVPEVKTVFILSYWLLFTAVLWTSLGIRTGRDDSKLTSSAESMAGGNHEDHDCHSLKLSLEVELHPVVDALILIFVAFISCASVPFVIQVQSVQNSLKQAVQKFTKAIK